MMKPPQPMKINIEGRSIEEQKQLQSFWTYKDLSKYLNISEETLRYYVSQRGLPYIKIGRNVRFDPKEIEQWIEKRRVGYYEM